MLKEIRQSAIVKLGGVIELDSTDLPVGSIVEVIILISEETSASVEPVAVNKLSANNELSIDEKWARFYSVVGMWKDDTDIDQVFSEIQSERQQDLGRETPNFDEIA